MRDLSLGHTSLSFGYPNEGLRLSRLVALPSMPSVSLLYLRLRVQKTHPIVFL